MATLALLYLHGFLSSPRSTKAQLTKKWLSENRPDIAFYCPSLSSYPSEAICCIRKQMKDFQKESINPMIVGSSLGGYWATWLSEAYAVRSVVVNPAVSPSLFKPEFLGVELKSYYSEDVYILSEKDVADLRSVYVETIQHNNLIWLLAQKGDEVCDYRLAEEKYQGCKQRIEEGGNHSFEGYENQLPEIIDFLEEGAG